MATVARNKPPENTRGRKATVSDSKLHPEVGHGDGPGRSREQSGLKGVAWHLGTTVLLPLSLPVAVGNRGNRQSRKEETLLYTAKRSVQKRPPMSSRGSGMHAVILPVASAASADDARRFSSRRIRQGAGL